jgi:hypothetical protein
MKYVITGHTSGIGKAIFESCKDAIGFSKSQGYDILSTYDRKRIIDQICDFDVFINNAHDGFGQTYMLLDLFHSWQNTNKTIINVGSVVAEETTILKNYEHLLEYQIQKKSLKVLHNDLVNLKTNLTLKYVSFGYVGTERILKKYPNLTKDQYITIDEAVDSILR